ncbi:MAG TPA: AsmA family protein, partial [Elusimicrobiota bacterium]|nr:AsmA family protein [Elusimicrobiota bacterium]
MGLRRFLKLALLSAVALIAAATLALWIFIAHEAAGHELKPRIASALSDFLGRPVTIDSVSWRPWPNAMLVGSNVRLYDDALKTRLDVDAPLVEAQVSVLSVLKLAVGITDLRFLAPRISLRRDKDGVWNAERLVDEISARPDQPGSQWGTLAFNWFTIEGGTVTIEDAAGGLASLSPLGIDGRGKLRFGRRRLHFPFDLDVSPETSSAKLLISGDLGGRTRLRIDVKDAEPSLARLAWPPAARWTGNWDGTFDYDNRRPAPWTLDVRAAPLVVSTALPTFDSLEATGEYFSPSSATFAASALSAGTRIDAKGATQDGALSRLSVDVKNGKASLAGLAWPPAASWTGRWDGSLELDEGPPARWRLHVRAAPLSVSTAAPRLDLLEASGDYVSTGRSTFFGTARSSTTEIIVKGSANDGALAFGVKSPRADLKTVLAFARAAAAAYGAKPAKRAKPARKAPAASWRPRSLTATLSAGDLRYGSTDFRDVRAVVRRSNGPYVLDRLSFDCLGGSITAGGSYSPSRADDSLRLNWKAANISIPDAFRLFGSTRDAGG